MIALGAVLYGGSLTALHPMATQYLQRHRILAPMVVVAVKPIVELEVVVEVVEAYCKTLLSKYHHVLVLCAP